MLKNKDNISILSNGEKAFQIFLFQLAIREELNNPFCIIDEVYFNIIIVK